MRYLFPIVLLFGLGLSSCGPSFSIPDAAVPRNEYLESLGRAGLLDSQRATEWQAEAEDALTNPERLDPPFFRSWRMEEGRVEEAEGYRFRLPQRGEVRASVSFEGEGVLFLDLYRLRDGKEELVFSTNAGVATFTARRDRVYTIIVQPEIYAEGLVSVEVSLVQ